MGREHQHEGRPKDPHHLRWFARGSLLWAVQPAAAPPTAKVKVDASRQRRRGIRYVWMLLVNSLASKLADQVVKLTSLLILGLLSTLLKNTSVDARIHMLEGICCLG